MTSLKRQMREDKATRDAARALIEADVEHVKSLASSAQFKDRAAEQAAEKGNQALKAAGQAADKNKGYLAALTAGLTGAAILWLAREPIQALFDTWKEQLSKDDAAASSEAPVSEAEESQ